MANDLKYLISSTGETIDFSAVVRGNIFADTDFTDNRVLIYNNKKVKASGFTAQSASNTGFGFIKGNTASTAWTLNITNGVAAVRTTDAGNNVSGLAQSNNVDWGVNFNSGKGSVKIVTAGDKLGLTKNAGENDYWKVRYNSNGVGSVKTRNADTVNAGLVILSSSKSDTADGHVATAAQLKAAWDAIDSKAGTGLADGTTAGLMKSNVNKKSDANNWDVFPNKGVGEVKTVTGNSSTEGLLKLSDITNGTGYTSYSGVAATPKAVAAAYTAATTKANRVAGTTPSTTSGIVTPSTENWKVDFSSGIGKVNKKWANDAGSDGGLVQNNDIDWGVKFAAKSAQDSDNGKGEVKTVLAASTVSGLASHNETNTPTGWGVKYGDTRDGKGFVTPQLAGTKNSGGEPFRGTVLPNANNNETEDKKSWNFGVRYNTAVDNSGDGKGYVQIPYAGSDPGVIKINPNVVSTYWRVQLDENKYAGVVPVPLSSTSSGIVNVYVGEEEREKYYLNSNGEWKKIENPKIALKFDDTTFKVYAQIYSGDTPPTGYVDGSTGVKVGADSVEKAKYAQYLISDITKEAAKNTLITQSKTNNGTLCAHILELT